MNIWLTTDTHFNHDKVVEYCGRPKDHEDRLWASLGRLSTIDLLIHLGDVCIGDDENVHRRIKALDCRTALVRGNHDKKSTSWYLDHGWGFVADAVRLDVFGKRILLTHVPVPKADEWDVNIHGHFHNKVHRLKDARGFYKPEHHLRLAMELTNYQPVTLQHVIQHPAEFRLEYETL